MEEKTLYQTIKQGTTAQLYHEGCDSDIITTDNVFGQPYDERWCTEHKAPICDLCKKELGKEERQICDYCRTKD